MSEIKSLTVRYLRELARKHLGKGHSRFKTKEELLAALKQVPGVVRSFLGRDEPPERPSRPASTVSKAPSPSASARSMPVAPASSSARAAAHSSPVAPPNPAEAIADEAPPRSRKTEFVPTPESAAVAGAKTAPVAAAPIAAAPVVEGFFVARVAGEAEARAHHLTDEGRPMQHEANPSSVYDERLGELPTHYEDDDLVLLPRDPRTLFAFWNAKAESRKAASEGLSDATTVLRLFDGGKLVREQPFALESRSYYLTGLEPGKRYRAEIHYVAADGRSRRLGPSSNSTVLPAHGMSADSSLRFLRLPWDTALSKVKQLLKDGAALAASSPEASTPAPRRYLEWVWTRVQLPGSAGFRDDAKPLVREEWDASSDSENPTLRHVDASEASPLTLPPRADVSSGGSHRWSPPASGAGRH